jgi:hypothetical protein
VLLRHFEDAVESREELDAALREVDPMGRGVVRVGVEPVARAEPQPDEVGLGSAKPRKMSSNESSSGFGETMGSSEVAKTTLS